jgi:hypothetical protein
VVKKKAKDNIPLPIFILICAVLLYGMYTSISTLVLAVWGDSVMGTVDSYGLRVDDRRAEPNRSRTISKGYWFLVNGKEYRGYVLYKSDEAIIYHILAPIGCLFLLRLVIRMDRGKKKKKKAARQPAAP